MSHKGKKQFQNKSIICVNSFYPRGTGIMFLLRTSCAETRTPIPVPAPPPPRNWRLRFTNIKTLLFFTITLRFQIRFVLATIVYFITDIVHKHPCNLLSVVNMFLTRHRRRKLTKALWKSVDTHRKRVLYVCGKYRKCVELTNLTVCGFNPNENVCSVGTVAVRIYPCLVR